MPIKRTMLIILAITALVGILSVPAGAVCAMAPYVPAEIPGVVSHITVMDEPPIVFEKEEFFFDMGLDSGELTATYHMYNPTDEEIKFRCAMPLREDEYKDISVDVDGCKIDAQYRYVYSYQKNPHGYAYNHNSQVVPVIEDEYIDDLFFKPDLKVTKYRYKITRLDYERTTLDINLSINWTDNSTEPRFVVENGNGYSEKNNIVHYYIDVGLGAEVTFYIIGEVLAEPIIEYFAHNRYVGGSSELIEKQETTFLEFASSYMGDDVSNEDKFNTMVTCLNKLDEMAYRKEDIENSLSQNSGEWLVYSIIIDAGQHLVNEIKMPMKPKYIYEKYYYKATAYKYEFELAAANDLNIGETTFKITSPYHVFLTPRFTYDSSEDAYIYSTNEKVEYGYIEFSLSTSSTLKVGCLGVNFLSFFDTMLLIGTLTTAVLMYEIYSAVKANKKKNKNVA